MSNRIYLGEDGLIHHDYLGDQTAGTLKEIGQASEAISRTLRKQKKKVLILSDLTKVGKQDSGARRAAFGVLGSLDYDKIALFGASPFMKSVGNFVSKAAGKTTSLKFFNTEEEASGWLKS